MSDAEIRILVIEDDDEEFLLLEELFRTQSRYARESFHLELAKSIPIAMDKLADANWDLFLVDYHLGRCSGLDFILEVQSSGIQVPALLVTGQDEIDFPQEAEVLIDAGRLRFLHKRDMNWNSVFKGIKDLIHRQLSVLLVDDDLADLEMIQAALRETGLIHFEVATARTLDEARSQLVTLSFDVIVLDYRLHGTLGSELMPDIACLRPRPFTLVCSSTGEAENDPQIIEAVETGHAGFFQKSRFGSRDFTKFLLGASRLSRLVGTEYRPFDTGRQNLRGLAAPR